MTVIYFGFFNALATFQAMINNILEILIHEGTIMIYLHDGLIFSNDLKKYQQIVKEVLKRLQDNDLFAKAEKCFLRRAA